MVSCAQNAFCRLLAFDATLSLYNDSDTLEWFFPGCLASTGSCTQLSQPSFLPSLFLKNYHPNLVCYLCLKILSAKQTQSIPTCRTVGSFGAPVNPFPYQAPTHPSRPSSKVAFPEAVCLLPSHLPQVRVAFSPFCIPLLYSCPTLPCWVK